MTDAYQYNKQSSSLNDKDPCDGREEEENPLNSYRFKSQETVFVPTTFFEEISIAPGEGEQPTWMLTDDCCEKLAFQYLFPEGDFGYKHTRELKLSTFISISWISHKCLYHIVTIFYIQEWN